jgi:hypothetical protein
MAQNWGNIDSGVRELEQANGVSTVEAYAIDLETNYRNSKIFTVPHYRYTKAGTKKLEDPRDIYELVANQGARRLRACILAVIPGDVVETAVKQCESTLHLSADISPDAVKKMLAAFQQFGVTPQQIEARIQRRIDAIQPAQIVSLKKIYASLRDGMSNPGDWFAEGNTQGHNEPASRSQSLKDQLKGRGKPTTAPTPAPPPEAPSTAPEALDLTGQPEPDDVLWQSILRGLKSAKNRDDLVEYLSLANALSLSDDQQEQMNRLVDAAQQRIG